MQALRLQRRRLLQAALAGAALPLHAWAPAGAQEAFPSKPLRLVVPFPAGGPTDIVARPLAQLLSEALGQQVLVENKGGAGGSIAADMVAKSAPDGYTMLMGTVGTQAINASLYKKLPYDPLKDFTPLGLAASAPVALVVNASTPYKSLQELVAAARRDPGGIAYGSAGNGTPGHLTGELFASSAGVKLKHVPYKGSAPAVTDLVGGQIPVMFDPVQSVQSHIKSGRLRALAVSSKTRSPVLPEVPTMAEAGLKDFDAEAWWGVFAPAKLPAREAALLRKEIEKVVRSEAFRDKLGNLGVTPSAPLPVGFEEFNRAELAKWGKAVRDSGAALD
ncbi:tripartite tricarboxylate transporter substrate binding protein [Ramlibacter rhizophilus]|uniref:Tripartite tricarboxylate transporter substrate binding protein n=2 Tax=Ramlibacter rhizophilus TaxID=1781167 RepID=A0A4Z0C3P0_9BURK|nr:tripartite tricarboxylate transporter substrate binding protein [Ramlibacter rhizophilus]